MTRDPYTVLGVKRSDTLEEIKKAFHRLAHTHHPDKGGNAEKFKEVAAAWADLQRRHVPETVATKKKDFMDEVMRMKYESAAQRHAKVELHVNGTKVELDGMDPSVAAMLQKVFNNIL